MLATLVYVLQPEIGNFNIFLIKSTILKKMQNFKFTFEKDKSFH